MILEHLYLSDLERKEVSVPSNPMGLQSTASGYGRKIPTIHMVKLPGNPRWRRVYCCIFSNLGTCYVTKGKDWIVIR